MLRRNANDLDEGRRATYSRDRCTVVVTAICRHGLPGKSPADRRGRMRSVAKSSAVTKPATADLEEVPPTDDESAVALGLVDPGNGLRLGPTGRPMPRFPAPPRLRRHGPAKVIAMCNQKGGVGKTTSAN